MADEQTKPPYNKKSIVPTKYSWESLLKREGDDLYCEIPIRISQAALGDIVRVPTLNGEAEIKIPTETQSGKVFRLRSSSAFRCYSCS